MGGRCCWWRLPRRCCSSRPARPSRCCMSPSTRASMRGGSSLQRTTTKVIWKHAKSDGHEDYGLLVSEPARKYTIIKELDHPVTLNDGAVVLQFEVRLQNGLECGGAYLKYIRLRN